MDFTMTRRKNTVERTSLIKSSSSEDSDSDSHILFDTRYLDADRDVYLPPSKYQNMWRWLTDNLNLFKGLLYATMSGLLLSLTSVTVKLLDDVNPAELAFYRFVAIMVYILPLLLTSRQPFFNSAHFHLLLLRSVFEAFSIIFRYYTLQILPLADANVIIFSSPVFVAIMARFFLKENCSVIIIITLFMTMLGLILVVKIPLILMNGGQGELVSSERLSGVAFGMVSVFFNASCFIIIRKIKDVHHTVIIFNLGWMAGISSSVITFIVDGFSIPKSCDYRAGIWVLLGLFSIGGQLFLTKALQLEQAGPISIARTGSDIILSFLWQLIFFGEKADGYTISGAVLVTFGGVLLNIRKWLITKPEDDPTRRRYWFLTL